MEILTAGLWGGGVPGGNRDSPSASGLLTMAAVVTLLLQPEAGVDGDVEDCGTLIALRLEREDL